MGEGIPGDCISCPSRKLLSIEWRGLLVIWCMGKGLEGDAAKDGGAPAAPE